MDTQTRRRSWGVGPKILTWIGAVMVAIGITAGFFGGQGFVNMVPIGVVTAQGEPGPDALGGDGVPGSVTVPARAGDVIVIWEVTPSGQSSSLDRAHVHVSDHNGEVRVDRAQVSGSMGMGGYRASTLAQFTAPRSHDYTIEVSEGSGQGHSFVVAEGQNLPGFIAGLFATIGLWFLAIGAGVIGVGMLVGGIVWGMVRARSSKSR